MQFSGHKRNRTPEEEPKENVKNFQQYLTNLHKEIEVLKNEIKNLKNKDEKKDELINTILEQNKKFYSDNKNLKDIVILNEKNIKELKDNNKELKDEIEEFKEKNEYLERKIDKLENEINELYPIVFSCQLRKLLKKLLEYISNDPILSSGFHMIGKDIHFLLIPK